MQRGRSDDDDCCFGLGVDISRCRATSHGMGISTYRHRDGSRDGSGAQGMEAGSQGCHQSRHAAYQYHMDPGVPLVSLELTSRDIRALTY